MFVHVRRPRAGVFGKDASNAEYPRDAYSCFAFSLSLSPAAQRVAGEDKVMLCFCPGSVESA